MKIVWTRRATLHLKAAYEYWAHEKSAAAANTMLERIFAVVELLKTHPAMGRTGRVYGTRELVLVPTPFLLAYRVRRGKVDILALLHGAKKWPSHF